MDVYLRAKFQVSSIILTSFRRGVILPLPPPPSQNEPLKSPFAHLSIYEFFEQKQPPEVFCKIRCFQKFRKIHRSLFFIKVAGFKPENLLRKKTLAQVFSCKFYNIFKNTFFTEHLFYRTPPDDNFWGFFLFFFD